MGTAFGAVEARARHAPGRWLECADGHAKIAKPRLAVIGQFVFGHFVCRLRCRAENAAFDQRVRDGDAEPPGKMAVTAPRESGGTG